MLRGPALAARLGPAEAVERRSALPSMAKFGSANVCRDKLDSILGSAAVPTVNSELK